MKKNIVNRIVCQAENEDFSQKSSGNDRADSDHSNTNISDCGTGDQHDVERCNNSAAYFLKRFGVSTLLHKCGAYKEKGVPISVILMYVFCLMFSPMSMYYQQKLGRFKESFSKNTVYRFIGNCSTNWHEFLLRLSCKVVQAVALLTTDKDGRHTFVVDDTPLAKRGKQMELVSKYHNHVNSKTECGYKILTLSWTDGVTTVPIMYSLIASSNDDLVVGRIRDDLDGRTIAAKIRKLARTSMPDIALKFVKDALKAGIKASTLVFDSWFTTTPLLHRLTKETNLTVIGRRKNSNEYLEHNGKRKTLGAIYNSCKKNRGKAKIKLSVIAYLLVKGEKDGSVSARVPVKLVFVANNSKPGNWICLLCTDTNMKDAEVVRHYGNRWTIEVMFKCCKQYLKLGKDFKAVSFEAQNAQIAIAYTRYMFMALEQRKSTDPRSCGELFMMFCEEQKDIEFGDALKRILSTLVDTLFRHDLPEELVVEIIEDFVMSVPDDLQKVLKMANEGIGRAA